MRKYPCGAEVFEEGVHFRIWAPKRKTVDLILEDHRSLRLDAEEKGYFSKHIENMDVHSTYQFRLDGQERCFPDPATRFQPSGPHGPSQIVDPTQFPWTDAAWKGIVNKDQVILYELHIGTFTPEGTWQSAIKQLPFLADLGVNVIEMMPVAEFCGKFNWGYDGVNLFAPTHNYGRPDDLRAFIDRAHALGLGVILDVVYNHFGPEGFFLNEFSDDYLNTVDTEWGRSINFDGPNSGEVRAYFLANAGYWVEEFHFDGLRLDACHAIRDNSDCHILAAIAQEVRKKGGSKSTYIIAENEQQNIKLALPEASLGYGLDAIWNEDFHHTATVRLIGHKEAYYTDYNGNAQEFISSIKYGFLYQGQWYSWQNKKRGSICLDVIPSCFVNFLENHDQVANLGGSLRLRHFSNPGAYRAMTTLFLLAPQIPLIFQGQEFGSTIPFYYFSDMGPKIAQKVYEGRVQFINQFESFNTQDITSMIPPPEAEETFLQSKLDWEEKNKYPFIYNLHKDLILLRKQDYVFSLLGKNKIEGAVLNENAFLLRYRGEHGERLLLINFGRDLSLNPCPEPLLAPPNKCFWEILWSSEKPDYGGFGNLTFPAEGNQSISGYSALILHPKEYILYGK